MTIWDCPITTPYGQVPGYPLNGGFHNGIDYGAPEGTDVTVNGVVIAKSGNTGYSTGPHCHVGHWRGGTVLDPGVQGGKTVSGAVVSQVAEDATNGKYVRVADADGSSWVYLHLSVQLVTVGQELKGEDMTEPADYRVGNGGDVVNRYHDFLGMDRVVTPEEQKAFTGVPWKQLDDNLLHSQEYKDHVAGAGSFIPVTEKLFKEKT